MNFCINSTAITTLHGGKCEGGLHHEGVTSRNVKSNLISGDLELEARAQVRTTEEHIPNDAEMRRIFGTAFSSGMGVDDVMSRLTVVFPGPTAMSAWCRDRSPKQRVIDLSKFE